MHPWEVRRYTLRELFYKVEVKGQENQQSAELIKKQYQDEWERARWQVVNIVNSLGAKYTSVYQLTKFPWDKPPEPAPEEDLLSKFPKYLKND